MGGAEGGWNEGQKKYSCKGKLTTETSEMLTKKYSYSSKIPHTRHNFSNGPPSSFFVSGRFYRRIFADVIVYMFPH